ncbi:tRNA uridine-5-carboxymethylaminomethyl(34) synthesis GTPase MnmE [Clostridium sp. E02]|uniref:tRNA uridine-5-carboxymethylaminomethyl(34) synthesis GTPase MnmE n=1 Tax=Clostridium sp. E02 TaxID=2487134 RepID=UPI000F528515|nr:tRNA uridine-5-carboxymethylaminomethyl(34) synthesis GTPase MnmE [Clostridium sp. E02]
MKMNTIAAIATAASSSGIGIVRISGEESFQIIDQIFKGKGKKEKKLSEEPSHTIHYGFICDGDEAIDEVLVLIMKGPKSYTAEDTVEIDCHGGVLVTRKILETVLKYGARPAEPGEFTKRAFLNGRMDLSQAEAVIDVIHAKNQYALKSSVRQMEGAVSKRVRNMREKLIYQIAFIESALDDPEHISLDGYGETLQKVLGPVKEEIDELIRSSENGRVLSEGIETVILGKPNAGKSSLLNALVGEERAIVTEIAGTTRDTLKESILLEDLSLNIIDTAGIRDTDDVVEKIGVEKAKRAADQADFIIYVVDGTCPIDENDEEILRVIRDKKVLVVLNKSDLFMVLTVEALREKTGHPVIVISAKEQQGIKKMEDEIKSMFYEGKIDFNDQVFITNARHKNALFQAQKSLSMVEESILNGMPEDFYSIDLMDAYEQLGTILGESVEEDLVNEIFRKFCMGK